MRFLLALAALLVASPVLALDLLPGDRPSTDRDASTNFNRLGAKTIGTERLTIRGLGSTGDASGMSFTPDASAADGTLAKRLHTPIFPGQVTTPSIALGGPGSTGDVSGMTAPPSPSAAPNTIARLLADRLPLAGGTLTGPLASDSAIRIGPEQGLGSRVTIVDTRNTEPYDRPTGLFFRQENLDIDSKLFHKAFLFKLDSNGKGSRETITVDSEYNNHLGPDFLVGIQFRSSIITGSGFNIPIASQCGSISPVPSTCHAGEFAVEGTGPLTRNIGLHVINAHENTTYDSPISHGILLNKVGDGLGWKAGLMFGLDKLPVGTNGTLIDTMTSNVSLRAGIDLSKVSPGTEGTILLPIGGSMKFGSGSGGFGGRIESVAGEGGGRLAFANGFTFLDFGNQFQNRFGPDGFYTSAGITAPNLGTTGSTRGTLCVDTAGHFFVKTTPGACV